MEWLACGSGGNGALLTGSSADLSTFSPLHSRCLRRAAITTSGQHTALLSLDDVHEEAGGAHISTDARAVLLAGQNEYGQLGLPSSGPVLMPVPLACPRRVVSVALGWEHTVLATAEGDVLCAGRMDPVTSEQIPGDGGWKKIVGLPPCREVASGRTHTVALSRDGNHLYTWGGSVRHGLLPAGSRADVAVCISELPGSLGAVPSGSSPPRFVAVACGWQHCAVLCTNGGVIAWGSNRHGQCGADPSGPGGSTISVPTYVAGVGPGTLFRAISLRCGWSHSAVIATRDAGGGDPEARARNRVSALASEISASPPAVASPFALLTWGRADMGQLGRPFAEDGTADISSGGINSSSGGGGGSVAEPSWRASPVCLTASEPSAADGAGTGARSTRLSLTRERAPGASPSVILCPCESDPLALACGAEHTLCTASCGCVFAWGWNEHGNLGVGDSVNRWLPTRALGVGCGTQSRAAAVAAGGAVSFVEMRGPLAVDDSSGWRGP